MSLVRMRHVIAGMSRRWYIAFASLSLFALSLVSAAQAPTPARYFPETGHTVAGAFLEYFESHGGLSLLGFPITDEFDDPRTGMRVQYFQRGRMEWHPGNPDPYKVQLGLLADEMGLRRPPLPASGTPQGPNCTYYFETGHSVCYAFLDYFRGQGGLELFGYPISEFEVENGFMVQYFQRARMEWHPERPSGQRIQLAMLGKIHYDLNKLDPSRLPPNPPLAAGIDSVVDLLPRATVTVPVAQVNGSQTAILIVRDQYRQLLPGVAAAASVRYADGTVRRYDLAPTDANGAAWLNFTVDAGRPGQFVVIDFFVSHNSLARTTTTSFLLWW